MTDLVDILVKYGWEVGLFATLVAALTSYIYRDWGRIQKLETRVQILEEEFRHKMSHVLANMELALKESTEQVTISRKIIEKFLLKNS